MITPLASWFEAAWTVLAIFGCGIAAANMLIAVGDLRAVRAVKPRNGRYAIARAALRSEGVRLVTMAGYAVVGVWAMSRPNSGSGLSIAGIILLALSGAQVASSVLDAKLRRYLADHTHMEPKRETP